MVDNIGFRAALICWLESEKQRVEGSWAEGDNRPWRLFNVPHEDIQRNIGSSTWGAMQQDLANGVK